MSVARLIKGVSSKAIFNLSKSSKSFNKIGYNKTFSTLLDKKELGEEVKYIRSQESKRKEEIRAKMEEILALEDSNEQKVELIGILEEKKPEISLISKLGLDDWKFAVPFALLLGIPAVSNEVLVIDAELQLTASFILFCSTMYTQVGPLLSKSLDDYGNNIYNEVKVVDEALHSQIKSAIEADELALTLEEDFKQYFSLTDQLAVVQADVLNRAEEHKYRESIVKKLDSLYALEESAVSAIRARTIATVKADVVSTFKTDKKAKDAALEAAIAVLSAGAGAKLGKDIVGDVFKKSLKNYKDVYAKQPAGSDPILVQLEKDIKAIATAPVIESKGGNVFVTNPL